MKARYRLLLGSALVPIMVSAFLFAGQTPSTGSSPIKNRIIQRELSYELGKAKRPQWAQKVSSGIMYNYLLASGIIQQRLAQLKGASAAKISTSSDTQGCAHTFTGGTGGNNTRVNQDCSLRRQAEESI